MQPSAPGYLTCFALSKCGDKGAFKRSAAERCTWLSPLKRLPWEQQLYLDL